jgi:glutaredoxin-related protein
VIPRNDRIAQLFAMDKDIKSNDVVLFMKGTPDAPMVK